jgi:hypothetical protein
VSATQVIPSAVSALSQFTTRPMSGQDDSCEKIKNGPV